MKDWTKFKVCPEDLPDVPDFKLLCQDGCYLFHPEDERQARLDKEQARLVGPLLLAGNDLKLSLEAMTVREASCQKGLQMCDATYLRFTKDNEALRERLESAYTLSDITLAIMGGAFMGGALTFLLVILT